MVAAAAVVLVVDVDVVMVEGLVGGQRLGFEVAVADFRTQTRLENGLGQTWAVERSAVHWRRILFGPEADCCWIGPIRLDRAHLALLGFLDHLCLDLFPVPDRGLGLTRMEQGVGLREVPRLVPSSRVGWLGERVEYIRHPPWVGCHRSSSP